MTFLPPSSKLGFVFQVALFRVLDHALKKIVKSREPQGKNLGLALPWWPPNIMSPRLLLANELLLSCRELVHFHDILCRSTRNLDIRATTCVPRLAIQMS